MGGRTSLRSGAKKCLRSYAFRAQNTPAPRAERHKDWIARGETPVQGRLGGSERTKGASGTPALREPLIPQQLVHLPASETWAGLGPWPSPFRSVIEGYGHPGRASQPALPERRTLPLPETGLKRSRNPAQRGCSHKEGYSCQSRNNCSSRPPQGPGPSFNLLMPAGPGVPREWLEGALNPSSPFSPHPLAEAGRGPF